MAELQAESSLEKVVLALAIRCLISNKESNTETNTEIFQLLVDLGGG